MADPLQLHDLVQEFTKLLLPLKEIEKQGAEWRQKMVELAQTAVENPFADLVFPTRPFQRRNRSLSVCPENVQVFHRQRSVLHRKSVRLSKPRQSAQHPARASISLLAIRRSTRLSKKLHPVKDAETNRTSSPQEDQESNDQSHDSVSQLQVIDGEGKVQDCSPVSDASAYETAGSSSSEENPLPDGGQATAAQGSRPSTRAFVSQQVRHSSPLPGKHLRSSSAKKAVPKASQEGCDASVGSHSNPRRLARLSGKEASAVSLEDLAATRRSNTISTAGDAGEENIAQNGQCTVAEDSDEYTDVSDAEDGVSEDIKTPRQDALSRLKLSATRFSGLKKGKRGNKHSAHGFAFTSTPPGSLHKSKVLTPLQTQEKRQFTKIDKGDFQNNPKMHQRTQSAKVASNSTPTSHAARITSSASKTQSKLLEDLRRKQQREEEIRKERELQLKARLEERKRKRDLRMQQAAENRKKFEQAKVYRTRNFEKQHLEQAAENKRRMEEQRLEEVQKKQLLRQHKAVEIEQRKKMEEASRLLRLREKEEVEKSSRVKEQAKAYPENLQQKAVLNSTYTQCSGNSTAKALPEKIKIPPEDNAQTSESKPNAAMNSTFVKEKSGSSPSNSTFVKEKSGSSPSSYEMTPPPVPQRPVTPPLDYENYDINDFKSDDSDDEENPRKPVPNWAKGWPLRKALLYQFRNMPDLDDLFGPIPDPDIAEMLESRQSYLRKRTSSAVWSTPPFSKRK